jgi:NAD(P)H-dependent FMN reductase
LPTKTVDPDSPETDTAAMTKLVAICGSLRKGSYNAALLRAAVEVSKDVCSVEIVSIRDIPLYDGDLEERDGIPQAVTRVKEAIAAADGLLLATPEYNGSIPGVLKNAIDWTSRPGADMARVYGDRAVGIIGATPGPAGTRLAQSAWLPVLRTLGTRPWFGKSVYVSSASSAFDAEGTLVDVKVKSVLTAYMAGFAEFARSARAH